MKKAHFNISRTSALLWGMALLMPLIAISCKPESKPPVENKTDDKGITLVFKPLWDGKNIVFKSTEFTRSNGEMVRINNWAMILSHVSLVKTDNSKVQLGDGYLFVDFSSGRVKSNFPTVPAGDYKGISFKLGLDSIVNHGDPTVWPADHPLNANLTGLHWGWATGYIFQAIDGNWKAKASDLDWNGLSLHTATDQFPHDFMLNLNFSLAADGHKTASIEGWIDEYFKNPNLVQFATDGSFSHSVGTPEVALMQLIMSNADDVFRLTKVE